MDSTSSNSTFSIRALTLNCWGLKYISTHRHARLTEIGNRIAAADPPPYIVGLQECWTQQDYEAIRQLTKHHLPHGKFYHSGIFGGGLAILSRWPFEESSMWRYPLNGRPAAFYRGDWYVGKGVACARIRFGKGPKDVVEVFCTHLHAPYEPEPHDSYLCHRTSQAWEIAKLMRHAHERGHLVLGLGDFNMRPLSLAHQLIETHSRARDVWRLLHPDSSLGSTTDALERARTRPVPSAEYNLTINGATCDSALNTWRWEKKLQKQLDKAGPDVIVAPETPDPRAKRLDYIFVSAPEVPHVEKAGSLAEREDERAGSHSRCWAVTSARVGMTVRHPKLRCSLSDHFSVEAVLELRPFPTDTSNASKTDTAHPSQPQQQHLPPTPVPIPPPSSTPQYLPQSTYTEILALTDSYIAREKRQRRLRLNHAVGQTAVTIGCLVGVWWAPTGWAAFLLSLVASLGTGVAILQALLGGLFVRSEKRALKEFRWEIENARERAAEWERERERKRDGGGDAAIGRERGHGEEEKIDRK